VLAAADFPITGFNLGVDLLNQGNLLADPGHNAQVYFPPISKSNRKPRCYA
jgi:hypothetical protein